MGQLAPPAERTCACQCGASLEGRRATVLYVNERHRQRAYRKRVGDRSADFGESTAAFWRGYRTIRRKGPKRTESRDSTTYPSNRNGDGPSASPVAETNRRRAA